jgi:hypothetical protein
MNSRLIDRSEWVDYVDSFSRSHEGWIISIAVEDGGRHRILTRDAPLRGITAEMDGGRASFMVFTGDTTPHAAHFVSPASSLQVDETSEGADSALTITAGDGTRTRVELRSPMLPELVDGIAH